jgi:hypothetical protein
MKEESRMLLILALQDLGSDGGGIVGAIGGLIYLAFMVLMVASLWKIYDKAGEPGWAAIVPIYNVVVLLKIVGRPIWWLLLLMIPFVNFIIAILVMIDLAKSFGQGAGYGLGLVFLPFIFSPMLAFGDASYRGPAAA